MNKMIAAMVELNQKVLKSKLSVRHFLYSLHISYRGDEVENPGYIMNMYWLPTIRNFQHYLNIVEPIVRINMCMHVNVCVTYFLLEFVPKIIKSITVILFCFERRLKIGQKREMRIYKWRYIYIYICSQL